MNEFQRRLVVGGRCVRLSWKGLFISGAAEPAAPNQNDRLFWCNRTQICLGPDGKIVDDYECNDTRPCYEKT